MANHSKTASPLTGQEADCWHEVTVDHYLFEEPLGSWGATETVLDSGFRAAAAYRSPDLRLDENATKGLLAYAAAIVWEANRRKWKRPFFMTAEGIRGLNEKALAQFNSNWRLVSPEDFWREAQQLTFEEKALRTLANLVMAEDSVGDGVHLPVGLEPYPGGFTKGKEERSVEPEGILFATVGNEGLLVLHYLLDRRLIREGSDGSSTGVTIFISPEGYAVADQVRRGGRQEVRRAFMICRFNEVLDAIFDSCYKPVGDYADVRCPVHRVKDVHHVDRIDDKIVRMIEEATIVVVDLTEQNFNVAFEAGYALALKKPIVWTIREEAGDFRPPFDIQSENILRWHSDKLDEFREALRFRMLAALDKATAHARSS